MAHKLSYSELEKKYNALLRANKTQALLDYSGVIYIELNLQGIVTHVNKKACEILEHKESDIIGKNWFENFLPEKIKDKILPISKKLLSGEVQNIEYHENLILTKSGEEKTIYWHNGIIKNELGEITGHLSTGEDITERKRIEKKLKQTIEIVNRSSVVAFVWENNPKWPISFVSSNVEDVLGYTATELTENTFHFIDLVHPGDITQIKNEIRERETQNKNVISHLPYRVKTKKGHYIWIKDTTYIRKNTKGDVTQFEGIITDITDHINIENQLQKQFEQQNTIFNSIEDAVYLSSNDFDIEYLNPAMIALIGHDAVGEKCHQAIYGRDTICEHCYCDDLKKHTKSTVQLKRGNKSYNVSSVLLNGNRKLSMYHDVTEIKEAKEKLIFQNSELIIAKETAEQSNKLKTEFINNMSHEIRTPLNGILGFSDFLNDQDITEETRKYYVQIIKNSGQQLLHIIDDILEISELGTRQSKLNIEEVCINDLILELFSVLDKKAKENKTPLYIKKSLSDFDSTVHIDKLKLYRILNNLIDNALKFTSNGFVEFGYNLEGESIVFYVKDTGIGIHKENHDLIFEKFSQAEKGIVNKVGGLGLGLSIANENATLMNGKLSLESELGKGSIFYVALPYKPVHKESLKPLITKEDTNKKTNFKVLVAEDEEVNYLYTEILLQEHIVANCTVFHAKNGEDAVELADEINDLDLILMDIKMPIMSGYEATKIIKKKHKNLPILALTAYSTQTDIDKALESGCSDVIVKPIRKNDFSNIIDKYLQD
jgi:PAS domain S-box-containing protein